MMVDAESAKTLVAKPLRHIPFKVNITPLGFTTNRLRGIEFDADGNAWIGAATSERSVLFYRPKTGECQKVYMKLDYIDTLLPVEDKIFVCGVHHPQQVIYNRKTGRFAEKPLESEKPTVWNGLVVGKYAYLFDCNSGLYRWDSEDDSHEFYPYTLKNQPPIAGAYVAQRDALYCTAWWREGMPETVLTKFDLKAKKFTAVFDLPWEDVRPLGSQVVDDRLYSTDMFGGYLMVFDLKREEWVERYRLPGYEQSWKYASPHTVLGPYVVCCLGTGQKMKNSNGTYGFDGRSHHFVDKMLVFDTRDASAGLVDVPSLSERGYATVAYYGTLADRVYGTCVDSTLKEDGAPSEHGPAYLVEFCV